ncbi:MAG: CPBP family intramembrane metalloprotease [Chloroflexota bacterium]|nr:CPBP family intramembrane metalloprotease [Chloroflexota bacterium]
MLRDLGVVALVLYFLWRAGESPRALGWTRHQIGREIALGGLLFVPVYIAGRWLEAQLLGLGLSGPLTPAPNLVPPHDSASVLLAVLLVAVVAISEETIFRGYLLLRFRAIVPNAGLALVLAFVIFALGHGYEGMAGVVSVGAVGAAFGAVYLWRRSLVAPATMHFLLDLVAIVLLPLLA